VLSNGWDSPPHSSIEPCASKRKRHGENRRTTKARFAHSSEAEFARLLDYYRVRFAYEPRCFAIDWDESGDPSAWFTPDFYLSDYDLYVELTTMKTSLATKKNRKLRRLQERYPFVNIKLFGRRDIARLFARFGTDPRT